MVHEDVVSCEACGATITHIICGNAPSIADDPDYYLCESCGGEPEDGESVWTEEDIRRITPLTDEEVAEGGR